MYNGILKIAEHPERNLKRQKLFIHPMNDLLVVGQDDNLIYQLTDQMPENVIALYEIEDGVNSFFANYAEDGEYVKS